MRVRRKRFFFEKKNQKTFGLRRVGPGEPPRQRSKVFCFFSSEKKTFLSSSAEGFTLLEVMIAFVIAALALSLMYEGATGGLRATGLATRTEEAISLAKSHLAAIGRGEGINQQETSGVDGDGFEWQLHIQPVGTRQLTISDSDRANDAKPSAAVLFDVRVTESWQDAGRKRQVVLSTHRLDVHTTEGQ
jgi:general secretion pathway protein I